MNDSWWKKDNNEFNLRDNYSCLIVPFCFTFDWWFLIVYEVGELQHDGAWKKAMKRRPQCAFFSILQTPNQTNKSGNNWLIWIVKRSLFSNSNFKDYQVTTDVLLLIRKIQLSQFEKKLVPLMSLGKTKPLRIEFQEHNTTCIKVLVFIFLRKNFCLANNYFTHWFIMKLDWLSLGLDMVPWLV